MLPGRCSTWQNCPGPADGTDSQYRYRMRCDRILSLAHPRGDSRLIPIRGLYPLGAGHSDVTPHDMAGRVGHVVNHRLVHSNMMSAIVAATLG